VKVSDSQIEYSRELHRWGVDKLRLAEPPEELLYGLISKLNELELQIGLASICIRTPHPQLEMLVLRWRPLSVDEVPTESSNSILGHQTSVREDGVQDLYPLAHGHTDEQMWQQSPFFKALEYGERIRIGLNPPPDPAPFPIIEDLVSRGMSDYLVFPIDSGPMVSIALSLSSLREGGFPQGFIDALEEFLPVLSLSLAYKVERVQFRQVLSAYIGREPASLVLAGQIRRGDLVSRQAALGFADLRGFTAASTRLSSDELLTRISTFFEEVYLAIFKAGGEIIKFMGDGVLFIVADSGDPALTCDRALRAVRQLTESIDAHNQNQPKYPLRFGCGLHFGEFLYGNIGSPARLDFTVIGPAVNLTSRLETLTDTTGEPCLISSRFAELTTHATRVVGEFDLKGIPGPQLVAAPDFDAAKDS